ncbi:MAG: Tim44/TimA family putative adaptor protein [Pseudomonadota bacterium]
MGNIDLILFAAIACGLIFKLLVTLGRREGNEDKTGWFDAKQSEPRASRRAGRSATYKEPASNDTSIDDPDPDQVIEAESGQTAFFGPARAELQKLGQADPDFDQPLFLKGARSAYEMILNAFCKGDRKLLESLLHDDVYAGFLESIDAREAEGQQIDDILVGIDRAEIVEAKIDQNGDTEITVMFTAQQTHAVYDKDGALISGDPNTVTATSDLWMFGRNIHSDSPNWKLIATDTG